MRKELEDTEKDQMKHPEMKSNSIRNESFSGGTS